MCRFIETMRVDNGEICHWAYHRARLQRTRNEVWGLTDEWNWEEVLPINLPYTRHKLRLVYSREGVEEISCEPYTPRRITSLRLVEGGTIDYRYKMEDRSVLQQLYAMKEHCDEVWIVRNNMLTDTSIANVALFDGKEWLTPASPLLPGTMRARLLDEGLIKEAAISRDHLPLFKKIRLMNAMLDWGECELPVTHVY